MKRLFTLIMHLMLMTQECPLAVAIVAKAGKEVNTARTANISYIKQQPKNHET